MLYDGNGNVIHIGSMGNVTAKNEIMRSINHRGFNSVAPENTIPAYILSRQNGFKYVECDVTLTSDGVAVLLHDATIDRTSNGSGSISQLTYAQVAQFDFGSWKSADYAGTKIPTFEEFILACKGLGLYPYIELKSDSAYTQEQIRALVEAVNSCGMTGNVTWISFTASYLEYVRNADPTARLGLVCYAISETVISGATALLNGTNQVFVDARYMDLTDETVTLCMDAGLPLEVWCPNTESAIQNLHPYVTGVTSDSVIAENALKGKYIAVS